MRDWLTCSHCQCSTVLVGSKLLSDTLCMGGEASGGKPSRGTATIFEALYLILGFQFPQAVVTGFNGTEYLDVNGDPERHLSLCRNCELVLGNLYKVYNLFVGLSNGKESFILQNSVVTGRRSTGGSDECIVIQDNDVEVICVESDEERQGEEMIVPDSVPSPGQEPGHQVEVELTTLEEEELRSRRHLGLGHVPEGYEAALTPSVTISLLPPGYRDPDAPEPEEDFGAEFFEQPEEAEISPTQASSVSSTQNSKRKLTDCSDYYVTDKRKTFRCDDCGQHYITAAALLVHTSTVHSYGQVDNQCPVCKRCFAFKSYLAVHMRYHTGERPFVCGILECGQTFFQLGDLRRHEAKHKRTGERVIVPRSRSKVGTVQDHGIFFSDSGGSSDPMENEAEAEDPGLFLDQGSNYST